MAATSTSTHISIPLGKYLASTDKKTRDKAIKNLTAFLSDPANDALPKLEMTKLWKGVFYCFWMSDKPLVQQALATDLAEILLKIPTVSTSLAFLRGFWEATVREWNSIDRLRIDKYYMLVRRFVNAAFRLLMKTEWDDAAWEEYQTVLTSRGGPLCPDDIKVPPSLAYHLADIWLEELDKALAKAPVESPLPAPLVPILNPFLTLAARTPTSVTYQRIQSVLIDPLLSVLSPPQEDEAPRRKKTKLMTSSSASAYSNILANACVLDPKTESTTESTKLKMALLSRIFDVASQADTRDANRRKMYAIWKNQMEDEGSGDTGGGDAT